ncbi:MAG: bifunctional serine/threonine-protein kinase/formylglycine-generating enzyme family protein [Planctomycetota bacterium]|jgi:serine/threonine protein kinase/formylglycine-generating enzyme required for sulfatase activity
MAWEADLMLALLGMQMGAITRDQLAEAGETWGRDRTQPLAGVLEARGFLEPEIRRALETLVAVRIRKSGGMPWKALVSMPVEEEIRQSLLALPLDDAAKSTLMETKVLTAGERKNAVSLTEVPEERYRMGREIGRGALGRVTAAKDVVLGREVAVKEMVHGFEDPGLLARFLREGEIAGRFMHPNIVPVFDLGVREEGGKKIPYFAMGRIVGRDLKEILQRIERGDESARREFNRPRLLRIFQEVCLAIAYAHDHGVIHRDLKPANVMVGKYGEVYVVDWGLAKVKGEAISPPVLIRPMLPEAHPEGVKPSPPRDRGRGKKAPGLTTDGDVVGTPAYMSPEQAEGRGAIDERSDVYSLGAILYQILTFCPPFEGSTVQTVITKVLLGEVTPPSAKAFEMRYMKDGQIRSEPFPFPESVPPELEEIVLKAMAKSPEERYASVMEIYDEIQRFLEGEKRREFNHRQALEKVSKGKVLVECLAQMRTELTIHTQDADAMAKAIQPFWPVGRKTSYWALQDQIENLRREIVRTFGEAGATFQEALGFERGFPDARAALADLYWDQYLREEEAGDENQMVYFEGLVRKYNDGQYDALLKGDGVLSVTTLVFPCSCMSTGREASAEEMEMIETHPLSGRALDGHAGAEGLPDLEPETAIPLKAHGPDCMPVPLDGADVWLFRFSEGNKILIPGFPEGASPVPDPEDRETFDDPLASMETTDFPKDKTRPKDESAWRPGIPAPDVLDSFFGKTSPYRPKEGLYIGKTPITPFSLPMGSYLLIIHKTGDTEGSSLGEGVPLEKDFHPLRIPLSLERRKEEHVRVTLFPQDEIPPGFLQITGGKYISQGDRDNPYSGPREIKEMSDFFLARFQVTCREYLEFLNALASKDPREAALRAPRESGEGESYWPQGEDGRFTIPTGAWCARQGEGEGTRVCRLAQSPVDWEEDWPVYGISWEDLMAYVGWRRECSGHLFTLPHEEAWEKAARGADGRAFPWGNRFDETFCNMNQSHEVGGRPCPVDEFPVDESPYGVRGLGGNARELCLNDPGGEYPGWRVCRGGSWRLTAMHIRASARAGDTTANVHYNTGGRIAILPRTQLRVKVREQRENAQIEEGPKQL